jgi:hypothetical protein
MKHANLWSISYLLILISVILTLGCISTPSVTPDLTIVSPSNGSVLYGTQIAVDVQISNISLVNKLGQTNVAGEGHLHYFLDVQAPTTPGVPAIPSGGSIWVATPNTSYTFEHVEYGNHTIFVELVNNDHTPLNPPVVKMVLITLEPMTIPSGSTVVNLAAINFRYNETIIIVPTCTEVVIHFTNYDVDVPHNFAVYKNSSLQQPIFQSEAVLGSTPVNFTFMSPCSPGTYYFQDDRHPTTINGMFIVQ